MAINDEASKRYVQESVADEVASERPTDAVTSTDRINVQNPQFVPKPKPGRKPKPKPHPALVSQRKAAPVKKKAAPAKKKAAPAKKKNAPGKKKSAPAKKSASPKKKTGPAKKAAKRKR
jgi:hypothetical protein